VSLILFQAGGEMTGVMQYAPNPELSKFQNENEKVNENEYLLVTSSPHPFIPFLIPYATNTKADLLIVVVAVHI
jgi:hypothetical protein